jgi:hypothetical protein
VARRASAGRGKKIIAYHDVSLDFLQIGVPSNWKSSRSLASGSLAMVS